MHFLLFFRRLRKLILGGGTPAPLRVSVLTAVEDTYAFLRGNDLVAYTADLGCVASSPELGVIVQTKATRKIGRA